MTHLKSILAATDGGPSGRLAVVRAASIARETGAELHAVHVVDPDVEPTATTTTSSTPDRVAEAELRRHLARIHPRPELHVGHGSTFVEIVHLARSLDVDLIVAGAHRSPGVRRFFIGTTAGATRPPRRPTTAPRPPAGARPVSPGVGRRRCLAGLLRRHRHRSGHRTGRDDHPCDGLPSRRRIEAPSRRRRGSDRRTASPGHTTPLGGAGGLPRRSRSRHRDRRTVVGDRRSERALAGAPRRAPLRPDRRRHPRSDRSSLHPARQCRRTRTTRHGSRRPARPAGPEHSPGDMNIAALTACRGRDQAHPSPPALRLHSLTPSARLVRAAALDIVVVPPSYSGRLCADLAAVGVPIITDVLDPSSLRSRRHPWPGPSRCRTYGWSPVHGVTRLRTVDALLSRARRVAADNAAPALTTCDRRSPQVLCRRGRPPSCRPISRPQRQ